MEQKSTVKHSFISTLLIGITLCLLVLPFDNVKAGPPEPTSSPTTDIVTSLQPFQSPEAETCQSDSCLLKDATPPSEVDEHPISALDTRTFYAIADATVLQGYPSVNLGDTTDMWAGYDVCLSPYGKIARSLIRFDVSTLPANMCIQEATLRVRLVSSCDYAGASRTIRTYRITSSWSESSVTWNNKPGYGSAYGSKSIVHGAWNWYSFDVTDLVKAWYDGTYTNHGIMLRGPETLGWRGFGTREWSSYKPQLIVDYDLDSTPPSGSIVINGGDTYATSTSVNLTLSASDAVCGVAKMRFSNNGSSWSTWQSYTTSKTWTLTSDNGTKTVYVQYQDHAGNTSSSYNDTIILDTAAPTGSIVINSGDTYATSTLVNLTLSASDAESGVSEMRFSNNGYSWSAWEPYATDKAWTLTSSDGTKTVYVRYQDNAGNTSSSYNDTIVLDTATPTGSIVINGGDTYATSTSVGLTLSANDAGSGVSEMCFSNNGSSWSTWESYATSKTWTVTSGDGTKTVYVRYQDNVGNISPSYNDTITLDTTAPSSSASSPASTSVPSFNVTWSGTDGLSGIATYDVQYRVGSSGTWTTWLPGTSGTSAVFGPTSPVVVENGETYYFRVRARDNAGNLEAYPGNDGDTSTIAELQFKIYLPFMSSDA
jgi:hypothetical protein